MLIFRHVNSQIVTFLWSLLIVCNICQIVGETSADSWLIFAREAKKVFKKCYKNHIEFADLWSCLKHNSLLLYDDIAKADCIPLTNTIELLPRAHVKISNNETNRNYTQLPEKVYDEQTSSWSEELKERVFRTISTHNIRFLFQRSEHGEARRRHRRQIMPAMVFGMAALGVIIIPMGFHILGTIGGLALLFGKMAMLIAIITNLKRVTANGVHHALYHTDHHYAYSHPGSYWERNDPKY